MDSNRLGEVCLENYAIEGDSPVSENLLLTLKLYPSKTEHVRFCLNLGEPSPKAKYSCATDSEEVP